MLITDNIYQCCGSGDSYSLTQIPNFMILLNFYDF